MTPSRLSVRLFVVLALVFSACASTPEEPDPDWRKTEVRAPSDRVLWKIALQSLQRMGFPLGAGLDPSSMEAETGWKVDLHPFKGEGRRTMAVVHMDPLERGVWVVEARVKRQRNQELARPLDPRFADWEWEEDDVEAAAIFLQHLRSALGGTIVPTEEPVDPIEDWLRRRGEEKP